MLKSVLQEGHSVHLVYRDLVDASNPSSLSKYKTKRNIEIFVTCEFLNFTRKLFFLYLQVLSLVTSVSRISNAANVIVIPHSIYKGSKNVRAKRSSDNGLLFPSRMYLPMYMHMRTYNSHITCD
ncbi:uncharacterized protein LOC107263695 [Cephus cinctus]|uniref:Uncharacterized protein LOC107263695 n=1 Tax=Cephus cinctus TaxID=211228 RepID=A0AAJ7VXZ1_CEPCN|nr:uncharacterized protein LOC107263695 [Cephus cinctus]